MKHTAQYIKDSQGNDILAVIPLEEYQQLLYNKADLNEEQKVPEWHKELLINDLQELEKSLTNDNSDNWNWEEIEQEIKEKYGY